MKLAWLLPCLLAAGENRLWWLELELSGACEEVRLDCGPDGATHLLGPFASGEARRLVVPVPVRSPLGVEGLAAVPLPQVELVPRPTSAAVRLLGWSSTQPDAALVRNFAGTLARPRPPAPTGRVRASRAVLLLVVASGLGLFALRRRPRAALAGGAAAAVLVLFLMARRPGVAPEPRRLLEWELGADLALAIECGAGRVGLGRERLEVRPAERALELYVPSTPGAAVGEARAAGAELLAFERVPAPRLDATSNGGTELSETWTRNAAGEWHAHGAWLARGPLGAPRAGAPSPGWLAGGLPPGRALLVARSASGDWWRCLGFERPTDDGGEGGRGD